MSEKSNELQKEFELERMILFSDAVFAIAITLIIIEIKFPEIPKNATSQEIWKAFQPVLIQFAAFILSFIFIGTAWLRHLEIFRFLKRYDKRLIRLNLVFLFFIVCFPFSASGITEHIRPGFMLPIFIYMVNITCVTFMQYSICNYIFRKKTSLTHEGFNDEKNYIYLNSKWFAIIFIFVIIAFITLFIILKNGQLASLSLYLLPIGVFIIKRRLKKYKPISSEFN